jgi:hypothetical protein
MSATTVAATLRPRSQSADGPEGSGRERKMAQSHEYIFFQFLIYKFYTRSGSAGGSIVNSMRSRTDAATRLRLERLGTETAFSVAQAVATRKARGNWMFPFHLGDINIPTAPHIVEAMNRAIADS